MDVKALIIICTVIVVLAVTVFYICTKIQIENFRVEISVLETLDYDERVLKHVERVLKHNDELIQEIKELKGEKNETD